MPKLLALVTTLAACSGSSPSDPDAGGPGRADADPDGYVELAASDWTLAPGTEQYRCVRVTATADTWLSAFRPIAPFGTHHAVLMVGAPDGPDGDVACQSALTKPVLYGSGVGTAPLALPPGVAVKVAAGEQILLNLHLFNATTEPLSGRAGIEAVFVDATTVTAEAGVVLAGKVFGLTVVPGASTEVGRCTAPAATQLYAIMPHMHQLGTHMKVSFDGAAGPRVLLDEAFSFDDQRYHVLAPAQDAVAGDRMTIECSYQNPYPYDVRFGESSEEEMCFAITFTIPRMTGTAGTSFCTL